MTLIYASRIMVREKRKGREKTQNINKHSDAFCVLCVFRGQRICIISVFICVHCVSVRKNTTIHHQAGLQHAELGRSTLNGYQLILLCGITLRKRESEIIADSRFHVSYSKVFVTGGDPLLACQLDNIRAFVGE